MPKLFAEYGSDMPVRLPVHKNPGLEIVYIKHGNMTWECDGVSEMVLPKSIYFTLPWQEHGSNRLFETGCDLDSIVIKLDSDIEDESRIRFKPEIGFTLETEQQISQMLCSCKQHVWPASPVMQVLIPEILSELKQPGVFHTVRVHTLLKQIILELAETIEHHVPLVLDPNSSEWRMNNLLAEIDREYERKWTLEEMAEKTGLKRTQFSEVFKHTTGEPPLHYLNTVRVHKAAQMLEITDLSITEIAAACGFSSPQHFAGVFKKKIGQTPLKYRKNAPHQNE